MSAEYACKVYTVELRVDFMVCLHSPQEAMYSHLADLFWFCRDVFIKLPCFCLGINTVKFSMPCNNVLRIPKSNNYNNNVCLSLQKPSIK